MSQFTFSLKTFSILLRNINFVFETKYVNNQQVHSNIYDVFYSQCSHQLVSAGIPTVFWLDLLQE